MKIIITGASGMVGEGVLKHCLDSDRVSAILMVNRRHVDVSHPKLKELIVKDFNEMEKYSGSVRGYDACFFCAGTSSVGMKEQEYTKITYEMTLNFAKALLKACPDMIFDYVSGAHTDAGGRQMWQRVKGKTEAALMQLGFKAQYNFRPGFMKPVKGQKHIPWFFRPVVAIYPLLAPARSLSLHEVAQAMIHTVSLPYERAVLEIKDIRECALAGSSSAVNTINS